MAKKVAGKVRKPASKAAKQRKKSRLAKASLVAVSTDNSKPADVNATFISGIGQVTASLFRNGVLINMQSISTSGNIRLSEVESGDAISINGVCTGTATISINVPTDPATPSNFEAGNINTGYDVL